MNLNMQVKDMWVPETEFQNDKNIMETAAQDTNYKGEKMAIETDQPM